MEWKTYWQTNTATEKEIMKQMEDTDNYVFQYKKEE